MSARHWYVVGNDRRRRGPLADAELLQFARGPLAGPRCMAWREGLTLWIPLAEAVAGLDATRSATPPETSPPDKPSRGTSKRGSTPPARGATAAARTAVRDTAQAAAKEVREQAQRVAHDTREATTTAARAQAEAALAQARQSVQTGCRRALAVMVLMFGGLVVVGTGGSALVHWLASTSGPAPAAVIDEALEPYRNAVRQFREQTDRCPQSIEELGIGEPDDRVLQSLRVGEGPDSGCALIAVMGPEPIPELQGTRLWWWQKEDGAWDCLAEASVEPLPAACF